MGTEHWKTIPDSDVHRRHEAQDLAERARQRLMVSDTPELREQIAETAEESGMSSIWLEVFAADIDMQRRLKRDPEDSYNRPDPAKRQAGRTPIDSEGDDMQYIETQIKVTP